MQSLRVPAFAKVNLCLDVMSRRPDGFHELRTIFQSLSLRDTLRLERIPAPAGRPESEKRRIELRISGNSELAAGDLRRNLVWRAVDALQRELRPRHGVRVTLEKRIPVGRGLGGGSSDAAAALVGMLRLCGTRIPERRLLEIASSLGADVPFFLFGGRAVGVSRGDEIYPLPDIARHNVLVVSPRDIAVSTADAYRWLGRGLTKRRDTSKLWCFCALCWSPQGTGLSNDFEGAVFRRHPRLAQIRRALLQGGAAEAALAGSGSAVFGVFRNPAQARRTAKKFSEDRVFLCTTLSRSAYVRALWGPRGLATRAKLIVAG